MIPADYDTMLDLARKLHYKSLTQLQETAFRTRSLYDEQKNIMVIGPTSSGKTLIPLLLYAAAVKKAMDAAEPLPRMLFIVPYRALASQKCHELKSTLRTLLGLDLSIAQSTGELRQSDNDIRNGRPTVSVVINEKAFLFARENAGFLSGYRYIVMDEIGLLADQNRGIKLDFLLSWAIAARPRPRMIALATPFYDWSVYAEHFGFERIISQERPTLLKCPVFFSGNGSSRQIDAFDWPDSCTGFGSFSIYRKGKSTASLCSACEELCPLDTPCRQDLTLPCPHTQQPCLRPAELLDPGKPFRFQLIADLCRWHLRQSHQVLIFWNDRENCRQLALYLFHELADMLREPPPLEECRQVVLQACTEISNEESGLRRTELISEDEMFGILEPEHYRALCAGVGFHSSAVPLELRSFVERRFLDSRELSIVCATETLAFGINSATDAVIVADMNKNLDGAKQFLEPNTYFNYIGRCGRLQPDKPMEAIVGWVHPILSGYSPKNKNFDPCDTDSEYRKWLLLEEKRKQPEVISSALFQDNGKNLPFLLLCLLGSDVKTKSEMTQWLSNLPAPEDAVPCDVDAALGYLLDRRLIRPDGDDEDDEEVDGSDPDRGYRVVEGREGLCGFTPSSEDFDIIVDALHKALKQPEEFFSSFLLYRLLETGHIESSLRNFRMIQPKDTDLRTQKKPEEIPDETDPSDPQAECRGRDFSRENLAATLQKLPVWKVMKPLLEMERSRLHRADIRRRLAVTAAVLCWADSANPRRLCEVFHIAYPLIQTMVRDLGYLLQITAECVYTVERRDGERMRQLEERKDRISKRIHLLELSVYFGLQPDLYEKVVGFFTRKAETSPTARELLQTVKAPHPGTARQLRRIFSAYITLIDALKCQRRGTGPRDHRAAAAALRELNAWSVTSNGGNTLWRELAFALKDEVNLDEPPENHE